MGRHSLSQGVTVPAKRGWARFPKPVAAYIRRGLPQDVVLAELADADTRKKAITGARIVISDGIHARLGRVDELLNTDFRSVSPVRRLGTYPGAPSNLVVHAARFEGHPVSLWAESRLEALWMCMLDRQPGLRWYRGQPCVMTWPIGNGLALQIPDLAFRVGSAHGLWTIKPEEISNPYTRLVLEDLIPETCARHGIGYALKSDMDEQTTRNLRRCAAWRWKPDVVHQPWWHAVKTTVRQQKTLGSVGRACGGPYDGRGRAIRLWGQCHFDVTLDRPLLDTTPVTWRTDR